MSMITRAYNKIEILPYGLLKKSSTTDRLKDEINYYLEIKENKSLSILFPRLYDHNKSYGESWMVLERYGYSDLGKYLTTSKSSTTDWKLVFNELLSIIDKFKSVELIGHASPANIKLMLKVKTIDEYEKYKQLHADIVSPFITINGIEYKNFSMIQSDIIDYIEKNMLEYRHTVIHGDMCFSNILSAPEWNVFKLIDPRGSFGEKGIYGDIRYDIAKLYHSVDGGYEFFIRDRYSLKKDEKLINTFELNLQHSDEKQKALLEFENQFFKSGRFNKKEIKIIEGCIFIGMCYRHSEDMNRSLAMYLTGVKILNEALTL